MIVIGLQTRELARLLRALHKRVSGTETSKRWLLGGPSSKERAAACSDDKREAPTRE